MFRPTIASSTHSSPSRELRFPSSCPASGDSAPSVPRSVRSFRAAANRKLPVTNLIRIRTSEKHAHNPFKMRTFKTKDLKPLRMSIYEKTWGGALLLTRHPTKGVCPERQTEARDRSSRPTTEGSDLVGNHVPSAFSKRNPMRHFGQGPQLHPFFSQSPVMRHELRPLGPQRTANSQPATCGIIPPHKRRAASACAGGRNSFRTRGGFSD